MYYVYCHVDELGEIVYVGKGKGGRAFAECNRKGGHKQFMLDYLSRGETDFVKFLHINLDETEALKIEEDFIKNNQPKFNRYFTDIWKEANKTRGLKGAEVTKKKCKTPLGEFPSLSAATKAHGFKDVGSILYRIKNKRKGFEYV